MKKIFTIITLLSIQHIYSQTHLSLTRPDPVKEGPPSSFRIVIESLPGMTGELDELLFDLENKGTYTFALAPGLSIPEQYTLLIKDPRTGNVFDLLSTEPHSFSINRPMSKRFTIQMNKLSPVLSYKEPG